MDTRDNTGKGFPDLGAVSGYPVARLGGTHAPAAARIYPKVFIGRVDAQPDPDQPVYTVVEQCSEGGTLTDFAAGRTYSALEVNGRTDVPEGTFVTVVEKEDTSSFEAYFDAGLGGTGSSGSTITAGYWDCATDAESVVANISKLVFGDTSITGAGNKHIVGFVHSEGSHGAGGTYSVVQKVWTLSVKTDSATGGTGLDLQGVTKLYFQTDTSQGGVAVTAMTEEDTTNNGLAIDGTQLDLKLALKNVPTGDGSWINVNGVNQVSHIGPVNPGGDVTTVGATPEGAEAALSDTWTADGTGGVVVNVLTRVVYNNAGDKVLYGYYRPFTYDAKGHLYSIGGETRYIVDSPVDCTAVGG